MTPLKGHVRRRDILIAAAAAGLLPASGISRSACAAGTDRLEQASLLLGGGKETLAGQIAPLLAATLARGLNIASPLAIRRDVGRDGVTAANAFDTDPASDGQIALITPGVAILAALAADPRVHFDYSRWVPVLIGRRPVITLVRSDFQRNLGGRMEQLFRDKSIRLAVSQPTGLEIPSLLGLSLLGLHPRPISGFARTEDAVTALSNGAVDAIQITPSPSAPPIAETLRETAHLAIPLFAIDGGNTLQLPSFEQAFARTRQRKPAGPLYAAWKSMAAASATGVIMSLPMLTPPQLVARWRHAATLATQDTTISNWAQAADLSLITGADAAPMLSELTPDLSALLALHRWVTGNTPRWREGRETHPT